MYLDKQGYVTICYTYRFKAYRTLFLKIRILCNISFRLKFLRDCVIYVGRDNTDPTVCLVHGDIFVLVERIDAFIQRVVIGTYITT